ncbi:MAG: hypothetical protein ABW094_22240 [Candidatus Thiodiazotropha sp.]
MRIAMLGRPFKYLLCGKRPSLPGINNPILQIEEDLACERGEVVVEIDECQFLVSIGIHSRE